jgi:hypothetical protein
MGGGVSGSRIITKPPSSKTEGSHIAGFLAEALKKHLNSVNTPAWKPIVIAEPTAEQKKAEAEKIMKQHAAYWDWVYSNEDDAEEGASE